jgi:hypothetical protein
MHLTAADRTRITGSYTVVREPDRPDVAAQSDPTVIATVSTMLSDIEAGGLEAVRSYAERLDGWTGGLDFEISPAQVEELTAPLPADLIFWYNFRNIFPNSSDVEHNFGLVNADLTPKPSFKAYEALAQPCAESAP